MTQGQLIMNGNRYDLQIRGWTEERMKLKEYFNAQWYEDVRVKGLHVVLETLQGQSKCRYCHFVQKDGLCCAQKSRQACLTCSKKGLICDVVSGGQVDHHLDVTRLSPRNPGQISAFEDIWDFMANGDATIEGMYIRAYSSRRSRLRCLQCLLDPQKGTGCQQHSDIIRDDFGKPIDTIERLKAWPREKMTACQNCASKPSKAERCMSIWSNLAGTEVSSLSETNPRRQLTYFSNT
jgi:hypothetical protein